MKKIFILLLLCIVFTCKSNAQTIRVTYLRYTTGKYLIADETTLKQSKSNFTITSSNDEISSRIMQTLHFTKFTVTQKRDNRTTQLYLEHSFTFPYEEWNNMIIFINQLNQKK